jgi:hypothetical protein
LHQKTLKTIGFKLEICHKKIVMILGSAVISAGSLACYGASPNIQTRGKYNNVVKTEQKQEVKKSEGVLGFMGFDDGYRQYVSGLIHEKGK